nr:odorant-binding protein [Gryllus bimaculatus]
MFEEMGLLVDGKFSQENAVKIMKEKLEEKPDEIEKHMQLIEKCNDEVASHDNKCETGPKLLECFKTFAPGFGIVLPGSE